MKDKKMNSKYMYLYTSIFLQRSAVVEWLQLSIVYNNHYPKLYLRDIGLCPAYLHRDAHWLVLLLRKLHRDAHDLYFYWESYTEMHIDLYFYWESYTEMHIDLYFYWESYTEMHMTCTFIEKVN
jgi:hypothetical protein